MARTVLAANTPVPTDRPIRVVITQDVERGDAPTAPAERVERAVGELGRHMGRDSVRTRIESAGGVPVTVYTTVEGRPIRPWTRAELEGQYRYLRIPFASISISYEQTLSPVQRARRLAEQGADFIASGGVAGAVADEATMDPPMEMDRRPLIAGIAAIVVGLAILVGILVWGGE